MKRIIDGKRYDTETAEQVAFWKNGYGHGDFKRISEMLFLTKKGSWFLVGEGGAMTQYSVRCDSNSWTGSEKLIPMMPGEAKQWLEEHGQTEALEMYFDIEDA